MCTKEKNVHMIREERERRGEGEARRAEKRKEEERRGEKKDDLGFQW